MGRWYGVPVGLIFDLLSQLNDLMLFAKLRFPSFSLLFVDRANAVKFRLGHLVWLRFVMLESITRRLHCFNKQREAQIAHVSGIGVFYGMDIVAFGLLFPDKTASPLERGWRLPIVVRVPRSPSSSLEGSVRPPPAGYRNPRALPAGGHADGI